MVSETENTLGKDDVMDVFKKASESKDIPKIYFNGATLFLNPGDSSMLLSVNESPVAVINMSFTVAKSVAALLGSMIADVEEKTGNKIMLTEDIRTVLGMK
ncbi:hypothetical protein [Candidatus Magnetominusculus dajiuhuensis]|uniref:hypothetical protein n=1 Tax=Candidatus Magnetominusculus dajiuhuensis TaxID=3137712 RepID=UPI003B433D13